MHNRLVEALLAVPLHLIVTMRTKTEYVLERNESTGKMQPRKLGMAPIQRDGIEYELDLEADMDLDHNFVVSKTRYKFLDGAVIKCPKADLGEAIANFLDGAAAIPALPTDSDIRDLIAMGAQKDKRPEDIMALSKKMFGKSPRELPQEMFNELKKQLTIGG